MFRWVLSGLLLTLPLWSGERVGQYPVALYTQFQQQPPAAVLEALQQEVETIMAPMAVEFEWRSLDNVTKGQVASQLAVIKFQGRCDPVGDGAPAVKNALGWTHVSEGSVLPFCDIDCDAIRHYLRSALLGIRSGEREEVYGRAVARVLAHELYHIFASTVHHGANGVGKSMYTVTDLLSRDFRFSEREAENLHANKPRSVVDISNSTR
jgi:hypothetical protein